MLERAWRKGNPLTLLVGMQTSTATMENSVEIPLKTGNKTAIRSSSLTAGHTHRGNQNWKSRVYLPQRSLQHCLKEPGHGSNLDVHQQTNEWIRKLWYIYTMEYYSAIKKNAFESVLMRGMKLEPVIQSEVSQKEKHQYSILMHIYGI